MVHQTVMIWLAILSRKTLPMPLTCCLTYLLSSVYVFYKGSTYIRFWKQNITKFLLQILAYINLQIQRSFALLLKESHSDCSYFQGCSRNHPVWPIVLWWGYLPIFRVADCWLWGVFSFFGRSCFFFVARVQLKLFTIRFRLRQDDHSVIFLFLFIFLFFHP